MAFESIALIKKAEDEVDELIQKAQAESNEITKGAQLKANEIYNKTLKAAKDKSEDILFQAKTEGQKKAQPIIDEGKREVDLIKNVESSKFDEAVSLVVERIVKNGDN